MMSQQSYAETTERFGNLIDVLKNATLPYKPNEAHLKVTALQDMKTDLEMKNAAVGSKWAVLKASHIPRNEAINKAVTGICDTVITVKNYVKSVFGLKSARYKQTRKPGFPKKKS